MDDPYDIGLLIPVDVPLDPTEPDPVPIEPDPTLIAGLPGIYVPGILPAIPHAPRTPPCNDSGNNRARFFQQLPGLKAVAQQLNVPTDFVVGLSSYESGWLDDHNLALHNLWGLTNAGGNNLSFPSFQAGNTSFVNLLSPYIQGAQTLPAFFNGLKKEGYNSLNPQYWNTLTNRINNIAKWETICGVH